MRILFLASILFSLMIVGCNPKDPSVLKIFVRSNNFILTEDATVRIVANLSEGVPEYFEETTTDGSGVAYFYLDEYFNTFDMAQDKIGYFTVYAKDSATTFTVGNAKARAYLTSTASITLDE